MSEKIIFVDIDGCLLPAKMHLFRENRSNVAKVIPKFDDFAIRAFNLWARYSNAKIVFSTYWADYFTVDELKDIMMQNGLGFDYHDDVVIPRKINSTRNQEIEWWLEKHPEVTNWIAVDDDTTCKYLEPSVEENPLIQSKGRWIAVSYADGISYVNFYDGCKGLNIDIKHVMDNEFSQISENHHAGSLW